MMHNILFIESGGGWGGSSSYLYSFLKYLNKENFNPVVFFYRNREGPFVDKIRMLGVKVFYSQKQKLNYKDKNILEKRAKLLGEMHEFFEKTKSSIGKLWKSSTSRSYTYFKFDLIGIISLTASRIKSPK